MGEFKDGLKHGRGKWKSSKNPQSNSYDGDYLNDKREGEGTFVWASGNVYRGAYRNDERNGFGTMEWTDGSTYEGIWVNGI